MDDTKDLTTMATPSNQLSIGGLDSDIPILPPLLFLSLLVFSIILQKFASLPLPFLPKSMKSWVNRISMFVMLLAVSSVVSSLTQLVSQA